MTTEPASRNHFFIGGEWVAPSSDRRFQLVDASTEEALGSVPEGVEADIDRAVAAARTAFDDRHGWASWAPFERAEAMARFSDALKKRSAELARAVSRQNGMPISLSVAFEGGFSIGRSWHRRVSRFASRHRQGGLHRLDRGRPLGRTGVR